MKPTEIKKLQRRSHNLMVRRITPNTLVVTSRSNLNAHHIVTIETEKGGTIHARCTCPWAQNGGYGCSHVMAALAYLAEKQRRAISFWADLEEAKTPTASYFAPGRQRARRRYLYHQPSGINYSAITQQKTAHRETPMRRFVHIAVVLLCVCDDLLAGFLLFHTPLIVEDALADTQSLRCDFEQFIFRDEFHVVVQAHVRRIFDTHFLAEIFGVDRRKLLRLADVDGEVFGANMLTDDHALVNFDAWL